MDITASAPTTVAQRVEQHLAAASAPLTIAALRKLCRARTKTICDHLAALVRAGAVIKSDAGYRLA
jgi:hypothetical protein